MSAEIPDKSYFKIGEVSRILGVEPYNIRYWESQFRALKPAKTKSRQRLYRRRDIEILLRIKKLLYEEGYTIAGAKKRLKSLLDGGDGESEEAVEVDDELGLTQEERRAYDDRLSRNQSELLQLRAEVATLSEELARQREEHAAQLEAYGADRAAVVDRLRAADAQIAALVRRREAESAQTAAEQARWESERAELLQRHELLDDENRALRAEMAAAHQDEGDIADLKGRLAAQAERAAALAHDVERLQRKLRHQTEAVRAELLPILDDLRE